MVNTLHPQAGKEDICIDYETGKFECQHPHWNEGVAGVKGKCLGYSDLSIRLHNRDFFYKEPNTFLALQIQLIKQLNQIKKMLYEYFY